MKFLIDNWMLIAAVLASGAMLLWPLISGGALGGSLSPNAAVLLINREKAVVVDVCEADEFATGHIVGSRNIPLGELEQKLPAQVKNRETPLIMVCPRGARASRAASMAKKLGYQKAQVLTGGLNAWKSANLPVEKS